MLILRISLAFVLAFVCAADLGQAQAAKPATITIRADQPGAQISRHIYGHFAEHLGRCIYGGLWVGPDSPIPNTRGVRNDVIEALRKIKIPNLRWPGGCFADQYHWRDGVGPVEDRPARVNIHWGEVVEDNSFGTHEFLDFAEMIGAEPYLAANVGSGSPREMMDWIEYLTYPGQSDLAELRRANGRAEPWKIPFLGIGNENWGCGGEMTPEYYSDLYKRFSVYARDFGDNKLTRIAGGPGGRNPHWLEVLMEQIDSGMQGVSLHYYTIGGTWAKKRPATGFGEADWHLILKNSLQMEEILVEAEEIMDRRDPDGKVDLYVDEWGVWHEPEPGTNRSFLYQQNTIRDALVAAMTFNIFHGHAKRVKMANIAQIVNVLQALILTEDEKMLLTPTYHVFDMYQPHKDATSLPLELNAMDYLYEGESIPMLSASASRDEQGRIHLSLVNTDAAAPIDLSADVSGASLRSVSGRILTADELDAHNTFDQPNRVHPEAFNGAGVNNGKLEARLPPRSIVVLSLETAAGR